MKRLLWIHVLVLVVVVVAVGLVQTGCGQEATTTTVSSEIPGSTSTSSTLPPATTPSTSAQTTDGSALSPYTQRPYLDAQPVDLSAITNLKSATLTDAQKQVLARQSFVGAIQDPANGPWKFWHIYETARYQGLPVLVTTDSVLNAYHGLFDTLLQRMEESGLYDQAVAMSEALYAAASDQWNTATDAGIKEDARLNMAFFSVANSLLKGASTAPDVVADEVDAELTLINGAGGTEESPILGYTEDYTQYKPRGHYTRSEKLQRYFKAMMWYGHTGFYINPRTPDITEEEAAGLTRRAILISSSLTGAAKQAWSAIYEPTSFLVGRADDLTVDDMYKVVATVFGTAQPAPDALADAGKIAAVRDALNKLPAPKIQSAVVPDQTGSTGTSTETREENQRSFRVMGQRFIPDSYAFQQLVWNYVGTGPDNKRDMPMGLDIMAVLGSDQAYQLDKVDFGQAKYANWDSQIKKVYTEFSSKQADIWPKCLYTGWLESLQEAMAFPADGAPDFMKTQAWARKSLNTALGSWTELRHDTILYAKQSSAAEGDGGEESQSAGYVEPYPKFYTKIGELATTIKQAMDTYNLTDSEATNKLQTMIDLSGMLATISQKELSGQALTADEINQITFYGGTLEDLETWGTTQDGMTLSPAAEKSPVVADVHSSYISGKALEEGTGYPVMLYVAFKLDGKLQILCGASYAYYEFTSSLDNRLTDEQWTDMLDKGQAPPRPVWTDDWIAR